MSQSQSDQGGAGRREVAYRLFAAEYEDADFSYSESDEERAPNYVVTPTGARVNRLFVVGVLTEVEQVNEDVLRARIVDPTGAFVVYAGQYQPDEMAVLERAEPPMFVSVTGKARTFQPEDSETVYTSVRPESINEVDAETRDRWTVTTAERTIDRIATMAGALAREERGDELREALEASGVDEGLASGTAMAIEHYGTTPTYLQALQGTALDAARVVAGDRDEVDSLSVSPAAGGSATLADLIDADAIDTAPASAGETPTAETTTETQPTDQSTATEPEPASESEPVETTADDEPAETPSTTPEAETAAGSSDETEPVEPDTPAEPEAETDTTETDTAASVESQSDAGLDADDDIGDFDTGGETVEDAGGDDEDVGDFDPGEFEMEDDERERIEEEFGTDFSTGTEVDDPGEADIETPDPEEAAEPEPAAADESDATPETEPEAEPEPEPREEPESASEPEPETAADDTTETDDAAGTDAETDGEPAKDVDLTDAVMETMRELNGGDGADREAVVEALVEEYGADPDEVEDAIQEALMDGRCYEPNDATLKPI